MSTHKPDNTTRDAYIYTALQDYKQLQGTDPVADQDDDQEAGKYAPLHRARKVSGKAGSADGQTRNSSEKFTLFFGILYLVLMFVAVTVIALKVLFMYEATFGTVVLVAIDWFLALSVVVNIGAWAFLKRNDQPKAGKKEFWTILVTVLVVLGAATFLGILAKVAAGLMCVAIAAVVCVVAPIWSALTGKR